MKAAGVLLVLGGLLAALAASSAAAATRALQTDPRIDAIATGIAGFPVTVTGEDDPTEWTSVDSSCPTCLGFALIPEHKVYIGPSSWATLEMIENSGVSSVDDPRETASAILDLIHETTHVKLASDDEGRVNACALQAFPSVIAVYFEVPATIKQTVTTTRMVRVRRVVYVRVHGRRVRRIVIVPKKVTSTRTVIEPNPFYDELFVLARAAYNSEPPPYSTGTCP